MNCTHCENELTEREISHWGPNSSGHDGLCCDCMDLSCGASLTMINKERAAEGKAPITKPWPRKQ